MDSLAREIRLRFALLRPPPRPSSPPLYLISQTTHQQRWRWRLLGLPLSLGVLRLLVVVVVALLFFALHLEGLGILWVWV